MHWQAITIETSTEAVEAVANLLREAGAEGVQIADAADFAQGYTTATGEWFDPDTVPHRQTGAAVTGFFAANVVATELTATLHSQTQHLAAFGLDPGPVSVTVAAVAETDWADAWKRYYRPLRITRYLTIVPQWVDYSPAQPDECILRLDPGMAFGTGGHPTTALILQLLESVVRGGETMIDVGTGSGILALAARALGVAQVIATDVDETAVANARENLALNDATGITVQTSDLLTDVDVTADLIVANILAEVLVPLIPQVPAHLTKRGHLLLSGVFYDKVDTIETALAAAGFTVLARWQQGDWVAFDAQLAAES